MEAEDILKIVGLIAFFVLQGVFGSKKKKKKAEEAQRRALAQAEAEAEFQQYDTGASNEPVSKSETFFDEVKRMLEEEKIEKNKADVSYTEYLYSEPESKVDFVEEDYFEKKHRENENQFFIEKMPKPEEEALPQTLSEKKATQPNMGKPEAAIPDLLKRSTKKKRSFKLKKAIIYQTLLERKYN